MAIRRVHNPSRRRRARRANPPRRARRANPSRRRANPAPRHHRRRRANPSRPAPIMRRRRNPTRRRRNPDYNRIIEHIAPFAEVGCGMVLGIGVNRALPFSSRRALKLRGLAHIAFAVAAATVAKNRHVTNLAAGFAGAGVLDLFRQNVPTVAKYLQADAVETVIGMEPVEGEEVMQADSLGLGYDHLGAEQLGADSLGEEGMYGENEMP